MPMTKNFLGPSSCLGLSLPGGESMEWCFGMCALSHSSCFFLILPCLIFVVNVSCGMWDLSSPTRDWTCIPCMSRLTAGLPGKSPVLHIYCSPLFTEVKVAQLCLTLCDPMDYTVPGILQARILEWVAFPWTEEPGVHSPWGHKELDTTEQIILFFLSLFLLGISWWSLEGTALLTTWHLLSCF